MEKELNREGKSLEGRSRSVNLSPSVDFQVL